MSRPKKGDAREGAPRMRSQSMVRVSGAGVKSWRRNHVPARCLTVGEMTVRHVEPTHVPLPRDRREARATIVRDHFEWKMPYRRGAA